MPIDRIFPRGMLLAACSLLALLLLAERPLLAQNDGPSAATDTSTQPDQPATGDGAAAPSASQPQATDPGTSVPAEGAPAEGVSGEGGEEDFEEQPQWIQNIDQFFGRYLVTPLYTVLFFDFGTSKILKMDNVWTTPLEDGRTLRIVNEEKGVRVVFIGDQGRRTVFRAPTLEELRTKHPEAYRIYEQYAVPENRSSVSIPFVVVWLFAGAIFFTVRMKFINVRAFWHAIRLTKGDYDAPGDTGEVSHFQALASALSATVGLGNIAGVAIAIGVGGPGATFWMIVIGLLGMSTKFAECSLGQMYRKVLPDGTVSGGPMRYLKDGLAEMRMPGLGIVLAGLFTVLCILASFGGGNAFQVGQSLSAVREGIPFLNEYPWVYGLIMAVMVGVVIIGGIRSIGAVAGRIVPFMCGAYVLAALYILVRNAGQIPMAFGEILQGAFAPDAVYGGLIGVMVTGIRRAVFSNEAGAGSAAIAHSAAKTNEPISEGIVALLEPFIDTVVVCTMTALVIVITGVYHPGGEYASLIEADQGAALTSAAFATGGHEWFRWLLYLAVVLFAYSTLISWSYYGERCWTTIFGERASIVYKMLYLVFTFLGSIVTATNVKDFSDLLILGMAFPNILGVVLLSGKVSRALDTYWAKYKSGTLELKQ